MLLKLNELNVFKGQADVYHIIILLSSIHFFFSYTASQLRKKHGCNGCWSTPTRSRDFIMTHQTTINDFVITSSDRASSTNENDTIIISNSEEEAMDSQQGEVQEDASVDSISGHTRCNVYEIDKGGRGNDLANTATSSIYVADTEIQGTGTVNNVSRACDTDVLLPCTCFGCSDFTISNQPLELPQSK